MPLLSRRTFAAAAALLACLLVATAPPARASTLEGDANRLTVTGAPGEANAVVLAGRADAVALSFTDVSSDITSWPEGLCRPADQGAVICDVPEDVRVDLGDEDDSFTMYEERHAHGLTVLGGEGDDELGGQEHARAKTFDGGPGDDLLKPYAGDDVILGGPGDDILWGSEGDDELRGGEGDDELQPDTGKEPGDDIVDGGPGIDHVDDWLELAKSNHPQVSISLDGVANDGRPGESDNVIGVEKAEPKVSGRYVLSDARDEWQIMANVDGGNSTVLAGGGDDTIVGEDHDETIDGGAGDDVLEGGRRNDTITGGAGRDTILGDESDTGCTWAPEYCVIFGNDTIDARDGEVDQVNCGPGVDRAVLDAVDVHVGCETVDVPGGPGDQPQPSQGTGSQPDATGGGDTGDPVPSDRARLTVKRVPLARALRSGLVVRLAGLEPGPVRVTARRNGNAVAKGRGTVGADGTASVRVRFTKAARRSLKRARSVKLRVRAAGVAGTVTLRGAPSAAAAAAKKKPSCPRGTTARVVKGAPTACFPAQLPAAGVAGLDALAKRVLAREDDRLPDRPRKRRNAGRRLAKLLGSLTGAPSAARARAAAATGGVTGIAGLGEPKSTRSDGDTRQRTWPAGQPVKGVTVEATDRAVRPPHDGPETGVYTEDTIEVHTPAGDASSLKIVEDTREALCPSAVGDVPAKVVVGVTRSETVGIDGKRHSVTATVRIDGTFLGHVGNGAKAETYDATLRGTLEIVPAVDGRRHPSRVYQSSLELAAVPVGTRPPDLMPQMVRDMPLSGPRGKSGSIADAEYVGWLGAATVSALDQIRARLAAGDGRWYERRECARLEKAGSSPDRVKKGDTARWDLRVLAADGTPGADARWATSRGCGALSPATATGNGASFAVADEAGAWGPEPPRGACLDGEVTSPAGRPRAIGEAIPPEEKPKPKRYRFTVDVRYREDMGPGIAPTTMNGTATIEAEEGKGLTEGSGRYNGSEWDGTFANPCGEDMLRVRTFAGDVAAGATVHDDGTVTIGWTGAKHPTRMSWILTVPVTGGSQSFSGSKPFCGEPGLAKTSASVDVRAEELP